MTAKKEKEPVVKFKYLPTVRESGAKLLERAHFDDAGMDLFSREDAVIPCTGKRKYSFNTGIHVAIPHGWYGELQSKSGLFKDHGLFTTGTIDSGYTGPIVVTIYNLSDEDFHMKEGMKLTQLVIKPCSDCMPVEVPALASTDRGDGGFGSTGV